MNDWRQRQQPLPFASGSIQELRAGHSTQVTPTEGETESRTWRHRQEPGGAIRAAVPAAATSDRAFVVRLTSLANQ